MSRKEPPPDHAEYEASLTMTTRAIRKSLATVLTQEPITQQEIEQYAMWAARNPKTAIGSGTLRLLAALSTAQERVKTLEVGVKALNQACLDHEETIAALRGNKMATSVAMKGN